MGGTRHDSSQNSDHQIHQDHEEFGCKTDTRASDSDTNRVAENVGKLLMARTMAMIFDTNPPDPLRGECVKTARPWYISQIDYIRVRIVSICYSDRPLID
jgi:hypothetical protein